MDQVCDFASKVFVEDYRLAAIAAVRSLQMTRDSSFDVSCHDVVVVRRVA